MDKKPADGRRGHFRKIVGTTPTLIVEEGNRWAVVFYNEGSSDVKIGFSGTASTLGMTLASGQGFTDNYSIDEWWAVAASGSGTVSGFVIR